MNAFDPSSFTASGRIFQEELRVSPRRVERRSRLPKSHGERTKERRYYRMLYWLTFTAFLGVACLARLIPHRSDRVRFVSGTAASQRPSVLAEARSAASATIGYAFMR